MRVANAVLVNVMTDEAVAVSSKFSDLKQRIVSAFGLGFICFTAIWLGGIPFLLLLAIAAILLFREWYGLTKDFGWYWHIFGFIYIALPCYSLYQLRFLTEQFNPTSPLYFSPWLVLFLVFVIMATDIGAYLVGRLVGGPKLAPRISPGKTWSGLFGGVICAMLVGVLFFTFLSDTNTYQRNMLMIICALLAIAAQIGDLFESWLKRKAGVKDSGRLLPGHGGLLDRMDGFMFTAPLFYLFMLVIVEAAKALS